LITLATYGVGMLIGFATAGAVTDAYKLGENSFNYKMVWTIPAAIAFLVMILFLVFFRNEKKAAVTEPEAEVGLTKTRLT
ncbi:MAG TPA: MFS transporter, partial [Flavisolibacter sp.]|nr:MFS transporter [Flavisolibacter sp.]